MVDEKQWRGYREGREALAREEERARVMERGKGRQIEIRRRRERCSFLIFS